MEPYDAFREALAKAAGTSVDRVALHTLHQHDAPGCDFDGESLLAARGLSGAMIHVPFAREVISKAAEALRQSLATPRAVTHLGIGSAKVDRVASNRRILDPTARCNTYASARARIRSSSPRPKGSSIRWCG